MKLVSLKVLGFIVGIVLSNIGVQTTLWLGSGWINEHSSQPWGLNTYIKVPSQVAYTWCGVAAMWLGGIFTGVVIALILKKVYTKILLAFLFPAIALTALGFNTLDWMLAGVVGSEKGWQAWVIYQTDLWLQSWDFYFLLGVVPLFIGGMLLTASLISLT
jgi:hypothetical protein